MTLTVEELDAKRQDRAGFDCGVEPLNRYLRSLAGQHRTKGISTSFVLIDSDRPAQILGYYTLSAASLAFERLIDADRKGLPEYPIPAVRIGRLATSVAVRGRGFGELLLQNAIKRIRRARNMLGVYAVIVEAKDTVAEAFYRKHGFRLCDVQNTQLYLALGAD